MKILTALFLFMVASNSFAEFVGCWDTTTLGIVKGGKTYLINRGPSESLWLSANKKTTTAILNFASMSPVKGWTICLEGEIRNSEVSVTDAFICTHDETVGACDPQAKIADSKLF